MFVHSFLIYKWLTALLKSLIVALKNFVCNGYIDKFMQVTVDWNTCCRPIQLGGLGLKSLKLFNLSLFPKMVWHYCF